MVVKDAQLLLVYVMIIDYSLMEVIVVLCLLCHSCIYFHLVHRLPERVKATQLDPQCGALREGLAPGRDCTVLKQFASNT